MTIHASHTVAAARPTTWYRAPLTGIIHGFVGIRAVCGISYWSAAWGIVGGIENVHRGEACGACIIRSGSTEAELHALDGNR